MTDFSLIPNFQNILQGFVSGTADLLFNTNTVGNLLATLLIVLVAYAVYKNYTNPNRKKAYSKVTVKYLDQVNCLITLLNWEKLKVNIINLNNLQQKLKDNNIIKDPISNEDLYTVLKEAF